MQGKVKWFDTEKGFGFITTEDGSEIFANFSQINMDGYKFLEENQMVEFEINVTDRGDQASNIIIIN